MFFIMALFMAINDARDTFQTVNVSLYSIIYKCVALANISHALRDNKWKKLFNDRIIKIFTTAKSLCNGIRCDTFYTMVLSKYAINAEIKKRGKQSGGKKQSGGMGFGWVFGAIICAISTIGVSANVVNSNALVLQIKEIRQTDMLADTKANILGTCGHNSLVAMLCAGMCPTDAELTEMYPTIFTDITNEIQRMIPTSDITRLNLTIGLISTDYTPVESNIEWFRKHFVSSDLDKSNIDTADIAITTAHIQSHGINILYNRITHKICIHDENYETTWDERKQQYIMADKPSYFCEPKFFTEAQLNIAGNVIKEVSDPILHYGKPIIHMSTDTFNNSNEHNTGTLDDYIAISLSAKQASINGMISTLNITIQNPDPVLNSDYVKTYADSATNLFNEYLTASPSVRLNKRDIDTKRANANAALDKIPKYSEAKLLKDIEYKKRMKIEADVYAKNAAEKQIKIDKMTSAEYAAYNQRGREEMHESSNDYKKNNPKFKEMYKNRDMTHYGHVLEDDYVQEQHYKYKKYVEMYNNRDPDFASVSKDDYITFIIDNEKYFLDNDDFAIGIRKKKKKTQNKTQKKTQKKKQKKSKNTKRKNGNNN